MKNKINAIKETIKKGNNTFNVSEVITITIISILIGILLGSNMSYQGKTTMNEDVPKELDEFILTYKDININYYKKVKKQTLVDAAMKGMLDSLDDPYSEFMKEEETNDFNKTVEGEYVGIGTTVSFQDNKVSIASMFNNSPAKKAGMEIGDQLIEIDGIDLEDKNITEITNMIKGKKGTKVKIKVLRDEDEKEFVLKRSTISIPSATSKIIKKDNQKIGYISIDIFSSNTDKQFEKELKKLENKKINSLIIDVRSNPGGHLDKVTNILDLFLKKGKILYQIEKQKKIYKIKAHTKESRNYKIVVLTNKASASASEILASSLKENDKTKVVGETTYGKGTVQSAYQLENGTSLKYTTRKWLTSKGKWINKKGVKPDYEEKLSEDYIENPNLDNDNQIQKAIEILTKKEN